MIEREAEKKKPQIRKGTHSSGRKLIPPYPLDNVCCLGSVFHTDLLPGKYQRTGLPVGGIIYQEQEEIEDRLRYSYRECADESRSAAILKLPGGFTAVPFDGVGILWYCPRDNDSRYIIPSSSACIGTGNKSN